MRLPSAALVGLLGAALLTGLVTSPATATTPRVISGTPNPPLKDAAVLLVSTTADCTGSLVLPNLIVTAAHCFVEDGVQTSTAADWQVFAPGADSSTTPPTPVRATQLLYNTTFRSTDDDEKLDVAYLVLDRALATPVISRVATLDEVTQLASRDAVLDQVGYGQTVPRAVDGAAMSPIPIGMSAPIDEFDDGVLSITTNGTTGTCAGDSGSPWIASIAGERLLVGVLSGGNNAPCESGDVGVNDFLAVPSTQPELLNQALAAAGSSPLAAPKTCIKVQGAKQKCTDTRTWTYRFCWAGAKYALQQKSQGAWSTIDKGSVRKSRDCNRKYPYLVDITNEVTPGTYDFRFVMPKQRGVSATQYDPFTVTSS